MSYQVTIEPTGDIIEVEEGQTILSAALRQGVWLPFACGHGTCATCKCQLVEGEADQGEASPFALLDIFLIFKFSTNIVAWLLTKQVEIL